jgi:hypothetical protein
VEAGPGGQAVDGTLAAGSPDTRVLTFKPGFKSKSGKFSVKGRDPFGAESPAAEFLVTFGARARDGCLGAAGRLVAGGLMHVL